MDLSAAGQPGLDRHSTASRRPTYVRYILLLLVLLLAIILLQIKSGPIKLSGVRAVILRCMAAIYPDRARAYSYLGKQYNASGHAKQGLDVCEKLVALQPEDASAQVLLGDAYSDEKRRDDQSTRDTCL